MTIFEEQMLKAQEEDQIIFYDYLRYKKAAGWKTRFSDTDWLRPEKIKKARYDANFLKNLPDYYFLGFPIKELLKTDYSNGKCSACAIALSLCFDDFEIVTCNLKNYVDYHNEYYTKKTEDFEHTVLLVNLDNRKVVIDTTFGFITDIKTYNDIFKMENVSILFSDEIKKTEVYKYINDRKNIKVLSEKNNIEDKELQKEHIEKITEYENLCKQYKNEYNKRLESFINVDLLNTSNKEIFIKWSLLIYVRPDNLHIEYPNKNLNSLEDDEFDLTLDDRSLYEETKRRNKKVLENYHKEIEEPKESKIKILFNKLFK